MTLAPKCFREVPWTRSDAGKVDQRQTQDPTGAACREWAQHHEHCEVCRERDWFRPVALLPVAGGPGADVATRVGDHVFAFSTDPPGVLCDIGLQLFARWSALAMLWRRHKTSSKGG